MRKLVDIRSIHDPYEVRISASVVSLLSREELYPPLLQPTICLVVLDIVS